MAGCNPGLIFGLSMFYRIKFAKIFTKIFSYFVVLCDKEEISFTDLKSSTLFTLKMVESRPGQDLSEKNASRY